MDQLPQYVPRRRKRDKTEEANAQGTQAVLDTIERKPRRTARALSLESSVETASDNLIKLVSPSLTQACVAQVAHALEGLHNRGNYTYESVPAIFRAATLALLDGELEPVEEPLRGAKKRQPILLTGEDYERYERRFQNNRRHRGVVIERATLTFLAQGL